MASAPRVQCVPRPPGAAVGERRGRGRWAACAAALLLGFAALPSGAGGQAQPQPAAAPRPAAPSQPAPPPGPPVWEQVLYGEFEGGEALLHGGAMRFGKLVLGDLNGNGNADLLLGKEDGRIARFENTGRPGAPRWRLVQEDLTALRPRPADQGGPMPVPIETGGHAAPALVDIDQDGDLDLFVGTGDGRLMFFRNIGTRALPVFTPVTDNVLGAGFGKNLAPVFADVTGNRAADLIVGNAAGQVHLLLNRGTQRRASYCVEFPAPDALPDEEPPCRPSPRLLLSVAPEQNATPGVVDWDGDGDLDLFVGKRNGALAYYENKGSVLEPDWRLQQERFLAINEGGYAAPAFLDVNGDGRPDILIGSSTRHVSVYTGQGTGSRLDVWRLTDNLLAIRRPGTALRQIVVAAGDLDGDGDRDLLVGDRDGRLLWLENVGSATVPAWRVKAENLLAGTSRRNLAPLLLDLDGDGDLDLLLGGEDGRLWLMRNVGTPREPRFVLETTTYAGVDVGGDSVPAVATLDGSGLPHLFVGSRGGTVVFYRNEGSAQQPDFRLVATRFAGAAVGAGAAPAFFDANGNGRLDLVLGSRRGPLLLLENRDESGAGDPTRWGELGGSLPSLRAVGWSAPHFADLNGDGRPDLLLGDTEGNLQLWYNRGPATRADGQQPEAAGVGSAGAPVAAIPPAPRFESLSGLVATDQGTPGAEPPVGESLLAAPEPPGPLEPVFVPATETLGGLRFKGRIRPAFGDLTGNGLPDLVVGTADGRLAYHRNVGTAAEPRWAEAASNLGNYSGGNHPSPLIVDLDGDGLPDLVVGTEAGRMQFFRNTGSRQEPSFTRVEDALTGVGAGRYAAPAVGYVNNDEHTDLIVGDLSGQLWAFVREGGAQSLNFPLAERRFLNLNVGVASTPFVGDINRDGKPDLLVGSDRGHVTLYALGPNGWAPGPDSFKGLRFPLGSSPQLVDLDGDGDLDLVTGSEQGTLHLFRNDALNTEPGNAR